jgi:hypothetical protein
MIGHGNTVILVGDKLFPCFRMCIGRDRHNRDKEGDVSGFEKMRHSERHGFRSVSAHRETSRDVNEARDHAVFRGDSLVCSVGIRSRGSHSAAWTEECVWAQSSCGGQFRAPSVQRTRASRELRSTSCSGAWRQKPLLIRDGSSHPYQLVFPVRRRTQRRFLFPWRRVAQPQA